MAFRKWISDKYGFRVIKLDGSNPGCKCLSEPFNTREEAEQDKQKFKAKDMEYIFIFRAESKVEAEETLQTEQFSRLLQ